MFLLTAAAAQFRDLTEQELSSDIPTQPDRVLPQANSCLEYFLHLVVSENETLL